MIKITERDHQIVEHIEKYQATIHQIALMFFPRNCHNQYYARRRLKALSDAGVIRFYKDDLTDKNIYYVKSENKPLKKWSQHRLHLMDFYANLVYHGAKIHLFKPEYKWLEGKYRSDGVFMFEYPEGSKWLACVEIDYFSKTDLEKYEFIFENGEFQEKFGTLHPQVFIVNKNGEAYKHNFRHEETENNTFFIEFNMSDFKQIVLAE